MSQSKRASPTAASEAIFGSAARGDADAMSDRDILIVDDDVSVLRARAKALTDEGWSVAPYTFSKLLALCGKGALFIQHIKLESSLLVDRDGRLEQVLAEFEPRASYRNEIHENGKLAALAGAAPQGARGCLLAADILYVTARNFGVLSLAERGIHLYGFTQIVEALEAEQLIAPGGARSLAALRFLKCLYRNGEASMGNHVISTMQEALEALPARHFPSHLRLMPPEYVVQAPEPSDSESAYLHLRDLERRLVALNELDPLGNRDDALKSLAAWIENPRAYANLSARIAPTLRRTIMARLTQWQSGLPVPSKIASTGKRLGAV